MRVELIGTAGPDGWPAPGCPCASCRRADAAAQGRRRPACVLVDRTLRFGCGQPPRPRPGYRVAAIPGGWDITGPSGRLLCGGPGGRPDPPPEAAGRYDIALLDLLADPGQLGRLRRRGLVTGETAVAVIYADHRVSSPAELIRRCLLWGVTPAADGEVLTAPRPAAPGGGARVPPVSRALVLGGARSGKSAEAELRLAAEPEVSYVATGRPGGTDPDWAARVAAHRARRPSWWQTVETADVAAVLGRAGDAGGAVLIDGVGGWLAGVMDACGAWSGGPDDRLRQRTDDLVSAGRDCQARVVAVSEETGLGVIPASSAGRLFRDQLGRLNQRLASESDETVLVVAGRVVNLPG
jgi:adenosylcobinamide kinase/adenosylcobinamide-phosphate guanylyltransferase